MYVLIYHKHFISGLRRNKEVEIRLKPSLNFAKCATAFNSVKTHHIGIQSSQGGFDLCHTGRWQFVHMDNKLTRFVG